MNTIRIQKQIDSETLHLPELKPLIGRTVEIVIRDTTENAVEERDWTPLIKAAGRDLIDPDVIEEYREFDRKHNVPPQL